MYQISKNPDYFQFGTNLGVAECKDLMKMIFDIKMEIGLFQISNVPNLNKF